MMRVVRRHERKARLLRDALHLAGIHLLIAVDCANIAQPVQDMRTVYAVPADPVEKAFRAQRRQGRKDGHDSTVAEVGDDLDINFVK